MHNIKIMTLMNQQHKLIRVTMEGIILLILLCSSFVQISPNSKRSDVDVIFHEHALKSILYHQQHGATGSLHNVKLPANLSGIHLSYVRLRSNTLWKKGANFSSFQIPSRTLPMPYVKRIVLLYEDFGNLSSQFYVNTLPGYSIVSSVVGFKVYDLSNPVKTNFMRVLDFNTSENAPISVHFPGLKKFPKGAKCAFFGGSNGEVSLVDMSVGNVCYSRSCNWFSVVVLKRKKGGVWVKWVIGAGLIIMTILLVIFVCLKVKRSSDEIEMEMENESVDLETVWIGYNKMPCATVTRTDPNLENAGLTS